MPRHSYGKTPWGAAFIATMEAIGGARLDRGRTYANVRFTQPAKAVWSVTAYFGALYSV